MNTKIFLIIFSIMAGSVFGKTPNPEMEGYFAIGPKNLSYIKDVVDLKTLRGVGRGRPFSIKSTEEFYDYYRDKNHVYYNNWVDIGGAFSLIRETLYLIEDADPETFEVLKEASFDEKSLANTNFSRDKNHVWFEGRLIKNADPKTFVPLNGIYAKDSQRAFCENSEIQGADLQTFKVNDWLAYDKNFLYFHDKKEAIDVETFEMTPYRDYQCMDKRHFFYLKEKIFYPTKERKHAGYERYIKKSVRVK